MYADPVMCIGHADTSLDEATWGSITTSSVRAGVLEPLRISADNSLAGNYELGCFNTSDVVGSVLPVETKRRPCLGSRVLTLPHAARRVINMQH